MRESLSQPARITRFWRVPLVLGVWALSLLSLDAAELTLGEGEMIDGWLAVPVQLSSAPGENVAALQFDVTYDAARMGVYDVEWGDAAYDAGKQVSFTPLDDGTARIIVSGFNQSEMRDGTVAMLVMEPYEYGPSGEDLHLQQVVFSDPQGGQVNNPAAEDDASNDDISADTQSKPATAEDQPQTTPETSDTTASESGTYAYGGGYSSGASTLAGDTAEGQKSAAAFLPQASAAQQSSFLPQRYSPQQRVWVAPPSGPTPGQAPPRAPASGTEYMARNDGGPMTGPDALLDGRSPAESFGGVSRRTVIDAAQRDQATAAATPAATAGFAQPAQGTRVLYGVAWMAAITGVVLMLRALIFRLAVLQK
jgi:hypothetical protein